jgi:hypothetical protein
MATEAPQTRKVPDLFHEDPLEAPFFLYSLLFLNSRNSSWSSSIMKGSRPFPRKSLKKLHSFFIPCFFGTREFLKFFQN